MVVPRKIKISQYVHNDKRKNNPPVGLVNENNDQNVRKQTYQYDPHLDPELRFDSKSFELEKLIDDAIGSDNKETMQSALEELKKLRQPYLNLGRLNRPSTVARFLALETSSICVWA